VSSEIDDPEFHRVMNRGHCRCDPWQWKAWHSLLHDSEVSVEVGAAILGINPRYLYRYSYSPSNPDHRCPHMGLILPATDAFRNTILIDALLRHAGFTPPRRRKATKETKEALLNRSLEQIGETLLAIAKMSSGLSDDTKRTIHHKLRKLCTVIDELDVKMDEPIRKIS
jgi:hypothetical protein